MIRSIAVLGAGTMGAQIAAHCANAGVPTLLLDLDRDVALGGLKRARALKPDPFFSADAIDRISIGGFDRDFALLGDQDWIIEAIVERLDLKQTLLEKVPFGWHCPGVLCLKGMDNDSCQRLAGISG